MRRKPRRWVQLALVFQLDLFSDEDDLSGSRAERSEHSDQRERSPSRRELDGPSTAPGCPQTPEPSTAGAGSPAPLSKACVPRRPLPPGVVRRGAPRC